jgi:preprotein translocase subunit YajC
LLATLFWLLAQADGAAPAGGAAPADGAGPAAGGGGIIETLLGSGMLLPLIATMALMYFLLMRPEQKKRREMANLLSNLKKNDKVVTIGGILGTVVSVEPDSKTVTIRVDEGTRIKILRSAISQVGAPDEADDAKRAAETKPAAEAKSKI